MIGGEPWRREGLHFEEKSTVHRAIHGTSAVAVVLSASEVMDKVAVTIASEVVERAAKRGAKLLEGSRLPCVPW
jgi:hypothetical protein